MKTFKGNTLSLEEQLGLLVYNLEQTLGKEQTLKHLKWGLKLNFVGFDDEFLIPNKHDDLFMGYIQVVQIIRYFGVELVTRFVSFNYEEKKVSNG